MNEDRKKRGLANSNLLIAMAITDYCLNYR